MMWGMRAPPHAWRGWQCCAAVRLSICNNVLDGFSIYEVRSLRPQHVLSAVLRLQLPPCSRQFQ